MRPTLLLLLLPFATLAQSGIHFEQGLSWTAIQAKAKSENKYIFMDCFTTWCGPCHFMTTQIFPQKESGDYFNDKFISLAVQLDTTAKDNAEVKAWYADGHAIAEQYNVRAYPTYLIFAPSGHIVHRLVGSRETPAAFISEIEPSFDTTKQYYTQLAQYQKGRRDTAFLRKLTWANIDAYDGQNSSAIAHDYLQTQTDLYNKSTIVLVMRTTTKSTDPYFSIFTDHPDQVDKAFGAPVANNFVRATFLNEGAGLAAGAKGVPDWSSIHSKIAAHLPDQADELTARVKLNYYRRKKDWTSFEPLMVTYMKNYSAQMDDNDLNTITWAVFSTCPDMSCVSEVLDWSKRLKETNNPAFLDTYANVLYKLGHKDDAITLEQRAIDLSAPGDKGDLQTTLEKMQKNEKTWN